MNSAYFGAFVFLLLAHFSSASNVSEVAPNGCGTKGTAANPLNFSQLIERTFRLNSQLSLDQDLPGFLPPEILVHEIFSRAFTSEKDFLQALLINKAVNVSLRKIGGPLLERLISSLFELQELVWNSEFTLYDFMFPLIEPYCNNLGAGKHGQKLMVREKIFARAGDLDIITMALAKSARFYKNPQDLLGECEACTKYIFRKNADDLDKNAYYYIPPATEKKLLDAIDNRILAVFGSNLQHTEFAGLFVPATLADCIIPGFQDRSILSEKDKKTLKSILRLSSSLYMPYFQHLLWACYFQTGSIFRHESAIIKNISSHLENELGMAWGYIFRKFPALNQLEH